MQKGIIILISVLLLTACSNSSYNKNVVDDKLQVYTSFYAVYDFVEKIGGDKISIYNIVPTGTEPHDWEPSAKDMVNLENADILFYNGANMESWIDKVKSSVSNKNLQYVELAKDIKLIKSEHTHDQDKKDHEEEIDPHVWLNPQNVKLEMEIIKNQLCELDSQNTDYYTENYNKMVEKLDALNNDYNSSLSGFKNRDIIVAHQAYGYLCSAYNLNQISIEGIAAESEPSPKRMSEITKYILDNNIKYIFYEDLINPKIAQTIANETSTQLLKLSPYEGLSQEQIDNGDDYFSVMYTNLENLKKALGD